MEHEPWLSTPRARVEAALADIAAGGMVILVDDEDRENEGDLVMAAEMVTPAAINFMATYGRGLICLPLTEARIDHLKLSMMVRDGDNGAAYSTGFTVSVEARRGVSTGISAADRATTIRAAVASDARPDDLVSPGHIFPLRARDGGVLVRAGQTEGSVDLARLAGLDPAGVICEIMNEDGTMARLDQLKSYAREHRLHILSVADMIAYRLQEERIIELAGEGEIQSDFGGAFQVRVYTNQVNDLIYLALWQGDIDPDEPTLVRVHSGNVWGDAFGALRSDRGTLLHRAMRLIGKQGGGVVLYILKPFDARHLLRKLSAHSPTTEAPAEEASDPYPTGLRDYGLGAQVLRDPGVSRVRLVTDTQLRLVGLEGFGLHVEELVATD